jgi:large subunit ribosomal protein L1
MTVKKTSEAEESKKTAKKKISTKESVSTVSVKTDTEILKEKKQEAKEKKEHEKEERRLSKTAKKTAFAAVTKSPQKAKRNPLKMHGKKYRTAASLIEKDKLYETLAEAIALLKKTSTVKFDASAEVHFNLLIDPTQGDQLVRSTVALPHGTGKKVRVIAFVGDDKVKEALSAGAIEAGSAELITKIQKGWLDFDLAIATPEQMKELGKVAKILGPKGLMPNPKAGTVTNDVGKTVKESLAGKIEFRNDKLGNLHNVFGKISFAEKQLEENLKIYLKAVSEAKPSGVKGNFINSITLASTMGPGIKLNVNKALAEAR